MSIKNKIEKTQKEGGDINELFEKRKRNFYTNNDTLKISKKLLGDYIIKGKKVAKIVETEAYTGPKDKASHCYKGKKTERNKVIFEKGGKIYVYLIYGMHWQLNIVTQEKDRPEAVLIRAVEPIRGIEEQKTDGPAKLCKALEIDKENYGEDLCSSNKFYIGKNTKETEIKSGPRINIDYAEEYADKPWRFWLKNNKWVSK